MEGQDPNMRLPRLWINFTLQTCANCFSEVGQWLPGSAQWIYIYTMHLTLP